MYEDEKNRFLEKHGYPLNLDNPQSFNEKIIYKKLFDRNPLIPLTADKYRVRQYIRDRIGWEADNHLIPLLYVTDNPENISFDRLPNEYIVKPNNGSGRWILAEDIKGLTHYDINYMHKKATGFSNEELINICKEWFKTVHGMQWYEWAYQEIKPLVIVEKLLKDNKNNIPNDCKFFMFDGVCKLVMVISDRFTEKKFTYYDTKWNKLDLCWQGIETDNILKPTKLDLMLSLSKKLSNGFDFVRIDFYICDNYIYFGEITHYPSSGMARFRPKEFDFELGKYWKLNVNSNHNNL